MVNLSKFILKSQRKRFKAIKPTTGFTLIELLIGMVLATLVVTPLMAFMLNIMDSESKEEAKATSEQEIQAALDFIAQDLKQAVYIYDDDGLKNNYSSTYPGTSGIKNQIPPVASAPNCVSTTTCVPVLVFWKRELRPDILTVTGSSEKDDTFVYSLVAYYLIDGDVSNGIWSDAARIARFQIKDGVRNPTTPINTDGTSNYITNEEPSSGFQLFDLTTIGISLKDKMNRWQKTSGNYNEPARILVDFVDQSTIDFNNSSTVGELQNCPTGTQRIPSTTTLPGGFYTCIDSTKTLAQVYIRGNALARLEKNTIYSNNKSIYFPSASIQIKGLGLLGIE